MAVPKDFSAPMASTGILSLPFAAGLVVDSVLPKGSELLEGGVHAAGPRIKLGVVLARCFVDRCRIGRQLIPEALEIDALPGFDQAFPIGRAPGCE
jgi:hypothetical protein